MRRKIALVLILALVLSLLGCSEKEDIEVPASFYYCASTVAYDSPNGVIASEVRETKSVCEDLTALLNLYLQGPLNADYRNPFPEGTVIEAMEWENSALILTVSAQFSQLTGLELTLASACLAKTALSQTGQRTVRIQCESNPLDGNPSITLSADSLLLVDITEAAPETTK